MADLMPPYRTERYPCFVPTLGRQNRQSGRRMLADSWFGLPRQSHCSQLPVSIFVAPADFRMD